MMMKDTDEIEMNIEKRSDNGQLLAMVVANRVNPNHYLSRRK